MNESEARQVIAALKEFSVGFMEWIEATNARLAALESRQTVVPPPTPIVREMLNDAREARAAIRYALQFLEDPTHKGDGHLAQCIEACKDVLATDGKWDF